ncbi:MAG: tol-pal system protein YbgF [Alphaproteobacteria bacterium]|nr:tol-pal system protein YbgF [Alphaproteobacteria bacterium]
MARFYFYKTALPLVAVSVLAFGASDMSHAQSDRGAIAAMEIRLQELEQEIRRLTGTIEEQNYEIRRLKEELETVTGDMQVRIQALEGGGSASGNSNYGYGESVTGGSAPASNDKTKAVWGKDKLDEEEDNFYYSSKEGQTSGQLGTIRQSEQTGATSPDDRAAADYERAFALIKTRDFEGAERGFEAFMNNYPDSTLIPNAKYWYGETFYVRGNYEKAARVFAEGYKNYPQGSKVSGNLLKLGMSLAGMGKTQDACVALKQLKKDYPDAAANILNRAETEMEKINCR